MTPLAYPKISLYLSLTRLLGEYRGLAPSENNAVPQLQVIIRIEPRGVEISSWRRTYAKIKEICLSFDGGAWLDMSLA